MYILIKLAKPQKKGVLRAVLALLSLDDRFRGSGDAISLSLSVFSLPLGFPSLALHIASQLTFLFTHSGGCSVTKSCLMLCNPVDCSMPGFPALHCLISVESVMPSNHLVLCHPLILLPSVSPSIKVFSSESAVCIRWPKYWSLSTSPSKEYSWLICLRMDWFDLAV